MSCGDGDSLTVAENVQQFLRDVLDTVVSGAVENETEERENLVNNVLEDIIRETLRIVEGKVNSEEEESDINQDESQIRKDTLITHKVPDKGPTISVKSADQNIGEDVSNYSDNESQQSLNKGSEADGQIKQTDAADETTNTASSILGHASRDTAITKDENRQIKTTGGNDAVSGNITNSFRACHNISDASAFTDRLENLPNKYGQQRSQSIKSLQSEHTEAVSSEKTDAKIRVRADELKGKLFTPFSKLENKKTRYGKVKIYHTGNLSADEQKRIIKEATELMRNLKEKEKEEKRRKRVEKEKKGIGAQILGFFRNLSCCKASKDE